MTDPRDRAPADLDAWLDGELDLARQLAVERAMDADPALRGQADALVRLRALVREQAPYHPAPAGLQSRVAAMVATAGDATAAGAAAAAPPAAAPRVAARAWWASLHRWTAWRPMVAGAGLAVLVVSVGTGAWRASQRGPGVEALLDEEVVASHVRATLAQRAVDVASSDHHTVKPWLSERLDFSPAVHAPVLPGSTLLGGRVDYVGGRPVAVLAYRQGAHAVDEYVWPVAAGAAGEEPVSNGSLRGFHVARWTTHGMAHRVVSDLNAEELAALVRAMQVAEAGG